MVHTSHKIAKFKITHKNLITFTILGLAENINTLELLKKTTAAILKFFLFFNLLIKHMY